MGVDKITSAQFEADIAAAISGRDTEAEVALGPIKDLHIRPPAAVFEAQNDRIRKVYELLTLVSSGGYTDAELDDFVANEGLVRRTGARATGTQIFSRATAPAADAVIEANFPVATVVDESSGAAVTFVTSEKKTLAAATAGAFFNTTTKRYELQVPLQALTAGASGNVAANRIKVPRRSLTEFDETFNRAATVGGADKETNAALIERYLIAILGSDAAVPEGLMKRVLDDYVDVTTLVLAYGLDPELLRAGDDAGAVDAHILGRVTKTVTNEGAVFTGVDNLIRVAKPPLLSVTSVTKGATTYVQGTDYVVVQDSSGYARSTKSADGVKWRASAVTTPSVGDVLSITYTYNGLIETLQSDFGKPTRYVFGRDLLFREAVQVDLTIVATLVTLPGFSPTAVRDQVLTALSAFLNAYTVGQDVEQFDIDREVARVQGVDNFVYTTLAKKGGTGVANTIAIDKTQYARIASADLVVTV